MKFRTLAAAGIVATLGLTGSAQASTVDVQSLSGDFAATNPSVTKVADGVHFGVYANGGLTGGSLLYSGANGLTLADITALGFTETHNSSDDSAIASPYLRVFLNGDTSDVVFDPTECATTVPAENVANHYDVVAGDVRYNDDACDGIAPDQQPWADVVAAHGTDVVSGIYITTGFAGGLDLSALVSDLTVNADTFQFNVPPADGDDGAAGANGQNGVNGQPGIQGAPGATTIITRIVAEPAPGPNPDAAPSVCQSGTRTLRVANRKGEKLLSARATLRGKRLKVQGRKITVPLAGQLEGNFNISIRARYRSIKSGKVTVRRSVRNLSVACA